VDLSQWNSPRISIGIERFRVTACRRRSKILKGGRTTCWYDRSGRVLGTVGAPGGYHFGPFGISPDGRTIAASLYQAGVAQMGQLETDRGIFGGLPQSNNNSFPAWAPDSLGACAQRHRSLRRIVFVSRTNWELELDLVNTACFSSRLGNPRQSRAPKSLYVTQYSAHLRRCQPGRIFKTAKSQEQCVLCLSFLQKGNIGVSFFPES
jgi:hypothetical protein